MSRTAVTERLGKNEIVIKSLHHGKFRKNNFRKKDQEL
jgi:hypothetical protein